LKSGEDLRTSSDRVNLGPLAVSVAMKKSPLVARSESPVLAR
jgi:hypothetical protein